ncbi:hypothetical protein EX30DRAFT_348597 [Ascodesmis nigricans]|uniref:Uncharacterized protein n=1 Tax=Ascodesmis nigricans TaxID=341454 RepID=A0A4S2MXH9_9PEZI|nr:hypothetical protein EX30DRAFT_348597 [Ascodesmis nigricans]
MLPGSTIPSAPPCRIPDPYCITSFQLPTSPLSTRAPTSTTTTRTQPPSAPYPATRHASFLLPPLGALPSVLRFSNPVESERECAPRRPTHPEQDSRTEINPAAPGTWHHPPVTTRL